MAIWKHEDFEGILDGSHVFGVDDGQTVEVVQTFKLVSRGSLGLALGQRRRDHHAVIEQESPHAPQRVKSVRIHLHQVAVVDEKSTGDFRDHGATYERSLAKPRFALCDCYIQLCLGQRSSDS